MIWSGRWIVFRRPDAFRSGASQVRAFIDSTGPLWFEGKLANKAVTATASASNVNGGVEATILGLYSSLMHWGVIVVPPGYTDQCIFPAGGNPYGYTTKQGEYDEAGKAAVAFQAKRLVEFSAKIAS